MALKRCDNGHYYDENKYTGCPSCGIRDLDMETTKPLRSMNWRNASLDVSDDAPPADAAPTRRRNEAKPERELGVTQAFWSAKLGIDPVVGWLVCIEGADKGRDYRIRSERNLIGRDPSMDICINGDATISREKHAVISFNPKKNAFLIIPGDSRGLIYLNDDEVAMPTELKPYDTIELGRTKLLFVPFCGVQFQWASEG
jgi:hypothetical protein